MAGNRGGKREGAGRKKKDTSQLNIKVPNEIISDLNLKFPILKDRNSEILKVLKKLSKIK